MTNRYLCEVLEEMRTCCKTLNFSYLPALIEEAQWMGNRMETSLQDQKDYRRLTERVSEKKQEHEGLKIDIEKLEAEKKEVVASLDKRIADREDLLERLDYKVKSAEMDQHYGS